MALCCVEALKSDEELVLPRELVEPTVLSVSPVSDSVSSVGAGAASAAEPFEVRAGVGKTPFSPRDGGRAEGVR